MSLNPEQCNKEVYKNGKSVLVLPGLSSKNCHKWVSLVADRCKQPVDWHYFAGLNNILALGDLQRVKEAMQFYWKELYDFFLEDHGEEIYTQATVKSFLGI